MQSYGNLPVHEARQQQVTGLFELIVLNGQVFNLLEYWLDRFV
jgi:hypothetical protein